ncbi:MAG: hypothetical protein ACREQQ_06940 [Candidatus Binatia bacterium]
MLTRVSCSTCSLFFHWTDDPAGLLRGVCRHPEACSAERKVSSLEQSLRRPRERATTSHRGEVASVVHRQASRMLLLAVMLTAVARLDALAVWPENLPRQPSLYMIRGYLDRAPDGARIVDRIEIAHGRDARRLLVASYGTPGVTTLDLYLSRSMVQTYWLSGDEAEVKRVMSAPPGTRIEGLFVAYTSAPPKLLIAELTSPAPAVSRN